MTLLEQLMSIPNINFVNIGIAVYTKNMACYVPEYGPSEINIVHIHGLTSDKFSRGIIDEMFKLGFRVSAIHEKYTVFTKFR